MTILTIEERIAASICWLSRQDGLPPSVAVRIAVAERHDGLCGWCDYPPKELIALVGTVDMSDPDVRSFLRLPAHQQRQRVEHSQAKEGAA